MNEDYFTSFTCENCRTEIEASPDMIGVETECPACGHRLVVPDNRDRNVLRHAKNDPSLAAEAALKSRTIRIELGDL